MTRQQTLFEISSQRHSHLCPRQVLGVRIGLAGTHALGIEVPQKKKRLLIFVETDGCFTDGVEVATIEHLLSVCNGLGIDNLLIELHTDRSFY